LPRPENLVLKEKKTKVTLTLSNKSIEFFKAEAKKHKASYQSMICQLLDFYVASQK
jgi:predicted DNA binding CopG/RHH family protein